MIEKKYNNIKGFENKNTFSQLDAWEPQGLFSAKNRNVFDFSYGVDNLSKEGNRKTRTVYGQPGDICQFVTTKYDQENDTSILNYDSWDKIPTINPDEETLYFDENAFGFVDSKVSGVYGQRKLADWADFFRAGYVEFSIKTDKQNCIIASGSREIVMQDLFVIIGVFGGQLEFGASVTSLLAGDTVVGQFPSNIDHPYMRATSTDSALVNLEIKIKDGKIAINYYDKYNRDDVNFEFVGNEFIADNEWHHFVINFGRPGLKKEGENKFNKKFIEIWVDGQLDKRFDDKVNKFNIFYPKIDWMFGSIINIYERFIDARDIETDLDTYGNILNIDAYVGLDEYLQSIKFYELALIIPETKAELFKGAIHTFAHGLNFPLDQYEIKQRHRLWQKITKQKAKSFAASAVMVNPIVSSNKKKAIKLFWHNLVDNAKFGIELDDSYQTETFSVTHKTTNSRTELYNVDRSIPSNINIAENVRIAITDEIITLKPGATTTWNAEESFVALTGYGNTPGAFNPKDIADLDTAIPFDNYQYTGNSIFAGIRDDLVFSGIKLVNGDRILLTGQANTEENGIWIFNGLDSRLTRANDSLLPSNTINFVYVTEGEYAGRYWKLEKNISKLNENQNWSLIEATKSEYLSVAPIISSTWKDYRGNDRFINVFEDINIDDYDIIVFMNYPENNEQIFETMPNVPQSTVLKYYNDFLENIKIAASNGASIFVSSPKLAEDLDIVKEYSQISQLKGEIDPLAASINPFEIGETSDRFFDTHRNNKYHLATPVPGLTDKETWIMSDFISYIPENEYENYEWHAKYIYRQFGLQENDEFLIPGLALTPLSENADLPGFRKNYRGSDYIYAVNPQHVLAGTIVTKLGNVYCDDGNQCQNPYDDYATTIVVHNGQLLGNYPINGKIFVNCTEDSYTFSRQDYNVGTIQNVPTNDPSETINSLLWQYSTRRLSRKPQKINIKELTEYGQTIPTHGGGGPIIQSTTNSSNGIIRSATDRGNKDYESDLYPSVNEEIYPIQEIPVLSMTWLGLNWLAE